MTEQTAQSDRFKAEMPHIPGVSENARSKSSVSPKSPSNLIFVAAAIVAALAGGIWYFHNSSTRALPVAAVPSKELPPAAMVPAPPPPLPSAPGPIATVEELAKPWSAKKFVFVRPDTHAAVAAMIIRLPAVAGERSSAYWAFALTPPFGTCDLEYVTDIRQITARFAYPAKHPMLAAGCSGTLYDPLRMGVVNNGAWVRGEVVQGTGIRPPTAIRVQLASHSIVADRIE